MIESENINYRWAKESLDPDKMLPRLFAILEGKYTEDVIFIAFGRVCDKKIEEGGSGTFEWYLSSMNEIINSPKFKKDMIKFDTTKSILDNYANHLNGDDRDSILEDIDAIYDRYNDIFDSLKNFEVVDSLVSILRNKGRSI